MPIPHDDLLTIGAWARDRVPAAHRGEWRIECEIEPRHVTLVEVRSPSNDPGGAWTRSTLVRLRYTATTATWTIFWRDDRGAFHRYAPFAPTASIGAVLARLDALDDPLLWG
ncbi:DUF3024 domain-containing protein [Microcella flavibacter]|uniref:DUF3024 domain-containing protein n=1 Tax=Microcella flavibacter TaxID=1804990 RepID=UPI0014578D68|nr:DUF3024 domain-containing protein [Microcella flavibacter]